MLKKTLTYDDVITGKKVTEDWNFNVARDDLIELLIEKPEMEDKLQGMVNTMDGRSILGILREFILIGVGRRESVNGRELFVKNEELTKVFRYSGAYDALFWELANDPKLAEQFLESLFPTSLLEEIKLRGGNFEDIRQQVTEGKSLGEVVAELPDKDWAAKPVEDHPLKSSDETLQELPKSGEIDTVDGEVVADPRTPFPGSLPEAISATRAATEEGEDDRPAWLRELREPTSKELLEMGKSEMALAFRLREEGKLNVQNKPVTAE